MYLFLSSEVFPCANRWYWCCEPSDNRRHKSLFVTGSEVKHWSGLRVDASPQVESRALICRSIGSQVYLAVCVCSLSKEQKCVWLWPALAWPLWPAGLTESLYEEKPPTLQWCSAEPTETPRSTYLMRLDGLFEKSHTEALQERLRCSLWSQISIYLVFVKTNCAAEQCHILASIRNQRCVTTPENDVKWS